MTDRDHFAAAALTGLLARPDVDADPLEHHFCCEDAYKWADAMLRERERNRMSQNTAETLRTVTEPISKEKRAEVSDGKPVAWAVVYPNDEVAVIAFKRRDADERASASDRIIPLYRHTQPTLTGAEREAVEQAAVRVESLCQRGSQHMAATLRGLLERMK